MAWWGGQKNVQMPLVQELVQVDGVLPRHRLALLSPLTHRAKRSVFVHASRLSARLARVLSPPSPTRSPY